ncbi:MAG: chemotaxis protein, partial [candidate division Zixibacteria bacterium]|nr:chemotaxis protein [candidate division Zixibacteria bacterium]
MTQKLAIAIVHGIGKQDENFAEPLSKQLKKRFSKQLKGVISNPSEELIIEPVFWQPCIQEHEDRIWKNLKMAGRMDWKKLRRFMIDFAGDAIAYQPVPQYRKTYDEIHQVFAQSFRKLAERAGDKAPLCVLAHSLGTIISSNYLYDLQVEFGGTRQIIGNKVRENIGKTPLEKGDTLTLFYTMGCPTAIWSLRYSDFGLPIAVPSPRLAAHWPELIGKWVNIYDRDDIIGYPMKTINEAYQKAV